MELVGDIEEDEKTVRAVLLESAEMNESGDAGGVAFDEAKLRGLLVV